MAKYTNEELYNALKLIKDICKEYQDCSCCPLRQYGTDFCGVQNVPPNEYDLIRPNEYVPFMYRG